MGSVEVSSICFAIESRISIMQKRNMEMEKSGKLHTESVFFQHRMGKIFHKEMKLKKQPISIKVDAR